MVPICTEWWCTEANEATQTHCYNPVAPAYLIWAYYAHGWQRRCQEDPVGLPFGRLEKTTGSSPHHVAQHHPTGSKTSSDAPRSSRFGSEPPSVEEDVDVWRYAIVSCTPETTTIQYTNKAMFTYRRNSLESEESLLLCRGCSFECFMFLQQRLYGIQSILTTHHNNANISVKYSTQCGPLINAIRTVHVKQKH